MSYTLSTRITSYQTEGDLAVTFDKWGVREWQAEFNVMRSKHRSTNLSPTERSARVRWVDPKSKREIVLSMDRQGTVNDNIRVLYLAIEALRMNEKRGIDETVRAAYVQLGAPGDHWQALDLRPGASRDEIEAAFRAKAKTAHPDAGGSNEAMAALNAARSAALAEEQRTA